MVVLVFNVGFTTDYVIKAVTQRGTKDVSRVVLVTALPKDEFARKKNADAINALISFLNVAGIKEVSPLTVDVDTTFENILLQLSAGLGKLDEEVEIYLVGGMRILLLALYYLSQVMNAVVKVKVVAFDEGMKTSYNVPLTPPKIPKSGAQIEVLRALSMKRTVGELAELLGKTQSTVIKQLDSLDGLVECKKVGRERECEVSALGKVVLNLLGVG